MNRGSMMNQSMGMANQSMGNQSVGGTNRSSMIQPNYTLNQSMGRPQSPQMSGPQMGNSMRPPMPGASFNNNGMNNTQGGFSGGNMMQQGPMGGNNGYNNNGYNNGYNGYGQQDMCSGCCQPTQYGMPVEEYICANANNPNGLNPLAQMCDCATIATIFFTLLSIVGFAVVMGVNNPDNIFKVYENTENTIQLQNSMMKNIPYLVDLKNLSDSRTDNLTRKEIYNVTTAPTATSSTTSTTVATTPTTSTSTTVSTTTRVNTTTATSSTTTQTAPPVVARGFDAMEGEFLGYNTSVNHKNVAPDPFWTQECRTTRDLTGTWGSVCLEQSLSAPTFYFHLHRWTVFRNTLYFIAMVGSIFTLALLYIIHRVKNPPFGATQNPANSQFQPDAPIAFSGTNFYLVFRAGWMMVSAVIFLWVATVMYEFWWIMPSYKDMTNGELRAFFVDYESKFVATVVCVTIYLCWPLFHLALEIGLFIVFIIPWYGFRSMCKPGLENIRYPIEVPLDDLPGWVRIDMFFTDFNQLKRLGFSVPMWHLVTGTYTEYFEFCNTPNYQQNNLQQQPPMSPQLPQPMNLSTMQRRGSNSFHPQQLAATPTLGPGLSNAAMMMAGQLAEDFTLSPTSNKRDKLEKSDRDKEKKSKSRERSKSKERSHHRRRSEVSAENDAFSRSVQGETSERTDKKEKRDKADKHHRSSSKRDKSDKKDKSERSKSKKDKKDKDSAVLQMDD